MGIYLEGQREVLYRRVRVRRQHGAATCPTSVHWLQLLLVTKETCMPRSFSIPQTPIIYDDIHKRSSISNLRRWELFADEETGLSLQIARFSWTTGSVFVINRARAVFPLDILQQTKRISFAIHVPEILRDKNCPRSDKLFFASDCAMSSRSNYRSNNHTWTDPPSEQLSGPSHMRPVLAHLGTLACGSTSSPL
jgi:hypothetical protein